MSKDDLNQISHDVTDERKFILERVEDGIATIEVVEGGEIVGIEHVNESVIPEGRYADGTVLEMSGDGTIDGFDHRTSAERQRDLRDKIARMRDSS